MKTELKRLILKAQEESKRNCALKKLRAPLGKYCALRSAAQNWKSTGNLCSPETSVKVRASLSENDTVPSDQKCEVIPIIQG